MLIDLGLSLGGVLVALVGSQRAVRHGVSLAQGLGLPAFAVGLVLFSLGTDLSELTNSVVSALRGHGDIGAGDAIGSVFTQATLILGLLPFLVRQPLAIERGPLLAVCALTLLGLLLSHLLLQDGRVSRLDGLALAGAWAGALALLARRGLAPGSPPSGSAPRRRLIDALAVCGWLAVVAAGATAMVMGLTGLSRQLGVPEYALAFLGASLGTSLPELVVDITALREGQAAIALGDLLGSCLVDATLAVGAGPLVLPTRVSPDEVLRGVLLAAAAMLAAAVALGLRQRHDRRSGVLLIVLYLTAYVIYFGPRAGPIA